MALAPFQAAFNGVTIGDGTAYDITSMDGLESLPAVTQTDIPRERDHGQFLGGMFAGGREVTLTFETIGTTDAGFRSALDALGAAFTINAFTELPFSWNLPGMAQVSRQVNVRLLAREIPLDIDYAHRKAVCAVRMWATDPRIYDSTTQTLTTTLPLSNGGAAWPITWPTAWGSGGGSGSLTITNAGGFNAPAIIVITGPVDNPTIENATEGKHLTFNITLANTDTLTVDLRNKTVILNGTASRRNTLSQTDASSWWDLLPGNNTFNYRANTTQVGSTAAISWQSTWI